MRGKLDILSFRLNVTSPEKLRDKTLALSLSYQYWIKPNNSGILYVGLNIFDNDEISIKEEKLFYNIFSFVDIIKLVKNLNKINEIVEEFER